jgi:hypothetical protein
MTITPSLFEAHLKCPTKCWLRANSEPPSGNTYAEWVDTQNESHRATETDRLLAQMPKEDCALSPPAESLKSAKWRLATEVLVQASALPVGSRRQEAPSSLPEPCSSGRESAPSGSSRDQSRLTSAATVQEFKARIGSGDSFPQPSTLNPRPSDQSLVTFGCYDSSIRDPHSAFLEARLHAVERVPSEGRGKAAQFIPVRFIFRNKLTKDEKLLLAFDASVLAARLDATITRPVGGPGLQEADPVAPCRPRAPTRRQGLAVEMCPGREIAVGKIIHGDDHATLKVKTSALAGEVRKRSRRFFLPLLARSATRPL